MAPQATLHPGGAEGAGFPGGGMAPQATFHPGGTEGAGSLPVACHIPYCRCHMLPGSVAIPPCGPVRS
eukprot:gene19719-biopygen991